MTTEEVRYGDWYSNDWLIPLGKKAEPIFDKLPRQQAIEVASAVSGMQNSVEANVIPWVTVFDSDDPRETMDRLLGALKTPDGQTPINDPELKPAIDQLTSILESHDLYGITGAHSALHFIRVAAGDPEARFSVYRDMSRKWPQYSEEWRRNITTQFGPDALKQNPVLDALLRKQELAAQIHYATTNPVQNEGESNIDTIVRAFTSLSIESVDDLDAADRLLNRRFETYRQATHLIRGIPFPIGS